MKESTRGRPNFSGNYQHLEFISLGWFERWVVSDRTAVVSRICSKEQVASLYSLHLAFFPCISLKSKWYNYTVVLMRFQLEIILDYMCKKLVCLLGFFCLFLCLVYVSICIHYHRSSVCSFKLVHFRRAEVSSWSIFVHLCQHACHRVFSSHSVFEQ